METLPYEFIRWIVNDDLDPKTLDLASDTKKIQDLKGNHLLLFTSYWSINWALEHNKGLELAEFGTNLNILKYRRIYAVRLSFKNYSKSGIYPFSYAPDTKRTDITEEGIIPYNIDITEIHDFDNLHSPNGVIDEIQKKAAKLYNAKKCFHSD